MNIYTVVILAGDDEEISIGEGESFEYARDEAIEGIPEIYKGSTLTLSARSPEGWKIRMEI